MTLEEKARSAWQKWGLAYAMYCNCSCCGEWRYCRGKRKGSLVCLDCFDLKHGA
jgi:hypothetical protein